MQLFNHQAEIHNNLLQMSYILDLKSAFMRAQNAQLLECIQVATQLQFFFQNCSVYMMSDDTLTIQYCTIYILSTTIITAALCSDSPHFRHQLAHIQKSYDVLYQTSNVLTFLNKADDQSTFSDYNWKNHRSKKLVLLSKCGLYNVC